MDDVNQDEMKCCKLCKCLLPISAFGMHKRKKYSDRLSNLCIPCDEVKSNLLKKEYARRRRESRVKEADEKKEALRLYQQEWRKNNPNYKKNWQKKNPGYQRQWRDKKKNSPAELKGQIEMVQSKAYEFLTSELMQNDLRAYYESEEFKRDQLPYRDSERFRMLAEAFAMDWANTLD